MNFFKENFHTASRVVVRLINLSLLLVIFTITLFSQENIRMVMDMPSSPEASSFMDYVDNPVNYSSGTPNISIPLYTISDGSLSEQVSLSYHAGGFKVNEVASWVGLGWNLNAGGMITRQIKGGPDEGRNDVGGISDLKGKGWVKDTGFPNEISTIIASSTENTNTASGGCAPQCTPVYRIDDVTTGYIDTEPDIFTYNFGGYSGKFIFDETGEPISIPKNDLDIQKNLIETTGNNRFEDWIIITPEGTRYYFGQNNAIEKSTHRPTGAVGAIAPDDEMNRTTTWLLTRIESFNGDDNIYFDYKTVKYQYKDRPPHVVNVNITGPTDPGITALPSNYLANTIVDGRRLTRIHTAKSNYEIKFVEGAEKIDVYHDPANTTRSKALSKVELYTNSALTKYFVLNSDFFSNNNSTYSFASYGSDLSHNKRQRLKNVQEFATDGTTTITKPKYDFVYKYDSNNFPSRYSLGRDHWGYYNGQNQNNGLIPDGISTGCSALTYNGNANKTPNTVRMDFGILQSITFPTGGTKTYTYESHRNSANAVIGGLRIQSIVSASNVSPSITTTYTYTVPVVYIPGDNSSYVQNLEGMPSGMGTHCIISSNLQSLAGPSANQHIAYKRVNEIMTGNGETHFYFDQDQPRTGTMFPRLPRYNDYGHGTTEIVKHLKENPMVVLSESTFAYVEQSDSLTIDAITVGVINCPQNICSQVSLNDNYYKGAAYQINTASYSLASSTEILDGVTKKTDFTYDATKQQSPISESIVNSDGKVHITNYFYDEDYTGDTTIQAHLTSSNKILPAWKVENYVKPSSTSTTMEQVDGTRTLYKDFSNDGTTNDIYPDSIFRYEHTWDGSGLPVSGSDWQLSHTIKDYNLTVGKPTNIQVVGWTDVNSNTDEDEHKYTYSATGKVLTWDFYDFNKTFEYFSTNDLLEKITEIDSTTTSFKYDDFLRLQESTNKTGVKTNLTYIYKNGATPNQVIQSMTFPTLAGQPDSTKLISKTNYDGLGRPYQSIALNQGSANDQSVVTSTEYDAYGRVVKAYEAIEVTGYTEANFSTADIPYSTHTATISDNYTLTTYEDSPLNRVKSTRMPGWNTSKAYKYETVLVGDNVLKDATVNASFWEAGDLFRNEMIDEDGNKHITFTDKLGRELVKCRDEGVVNMMVTRSDTYYSYDDKHRIETVYPPSGINNVPHTTDANLLYSYTYLGNDLLKTKQLPDQMGVHEYVYDQRDLLRFYQDPKMRSENRWRIAMYDKYGREELAGFYDKQVLDPMVDIPTPQSAYFDFAKVSFYGVDAEIDKLTRRFSQGGIHYYYYDDAGRTSRIQRGSPYHFFAHYVYDASLGPEISINNLKYIYAAPSNPPQYVEYTTGNHHWKDIIYDSGDNAIEQTTGLYVYPEGARLSLQSEVDFANRMVKENVHLDEGLRYDNNQILIEGPQYTHELAAYNYTAKGQVASTKLGGGTAPLETVTYDYLPNGFLEEIGDITSSTLAFSLKLDYLKSGVPGNGNIYKANWRQKTYGTDNSTYTYDFLDRIKTSTQTQGISTSYEYKDHRGNLDMITRAIAFNDIDVLQYAYYDNTGSNKIQNIADAASPDDPGMGYYKKGTGDYKYDANGNMTEDPRTAAVIVYDHNNLPVKITTPDGVIDYTYTFDGELISKKVTEGGNVTSERTYFENIEIENDEIDRIHHSNGYLKRGDYCNTNNTLTLTGEEVQTKEYTALEISSSRDVTTADTVQYTGKDRVTLTEGFSAPSTKNLRVLIGSVNCVELENSFIPHYFVKDHLGNVRAEFKEEADANGNNVSAVTIGEYNYFPFGGRLGGIDQSDNAYQYNGKERQEELDLRYYNYGARFYDPTIARFMGVDPISDQFPHVSTYNYAENRVPNGIDLHGLQFVPMHDLNLNNGLSSQEKAEFRSGATTASNIAAPILAEVGAGLTPAGPALDVKDFGAAAAKGDGVGMLLSGVGFLGPVGDFVKGVGKASRTVFNLIPTEAGAQSTKTINEIADELKGASSQGEFNKIILGSDGPIRIIEIDGKQYIDDGHHRVLAAEQANTGFNLPIEKVQAKDTRFGTNENVIEASKENH